MLLREYLFKYRITQKSFAHKLGISRVHMSYIISGKNYASHELASQIEHETDGLVTCDQFLSEKKLHKKKLRKKDKPIKKHLRKIKEIKKEEPIQVHTVDSVMTPFTVMSLEKGACYLKNAISNYKENNSVAKN